MSEPVGQSPSADQPNPPAQTQDHGQLMDAVYRHQRLIYDITRKYYLLGRDHLIRHLDAKDGDHILEVACGTGRNLAAIRRRYPDVKLYGVDISREMLISATKKLGDRAILAEADACAFEPAEALKQPQFDHIVLSYCLSMIPDWQGAIAESLRHLAPGGMIHIVDFGDQARLPVWFKRALSGWLAKFHVSPRENLATIAHALAQQHNITISYQPLYRGYAQFCRIQRPG